MDKLTCMQAFVSVVENGGFSSAARKSGLSKALVSKYVGQLEEFWTCAYCTGLPDG